MTEKIPEKPKRPPGRPKGYPRSGGRKKGTPNKARAATVERIQREADPLGFLCNVCRGVRMEAADGPGAKKRTFWYPTGEQRISAAQTLARKVLPDMKAVELAGPNGEPMISHIERVIVDVSDGKLIPGITQPIGPPRETKAAPDPEANSTLHREAG